MSGSKRTKRLKMTTQTLENRRPAPDAHAAKHLIFKLGEECYAIPVLKVREIIRLLEITPIPQMPTFILGVINLRGKIVPVLDLRIRFGLRGSQTTQSTCIVVVQVKTPKGHNIQMGLVVDGVQEVLNIHPGEIEETPKFGTRQTPEFLPGIAQVKGQVVALVDLDQVLPGESLEQITRTTPPP
jgi:purine-binding chemotaxis protein CheW